MARATLDPLFQHIRGKLGNLVFRKYGKTTVVYEYEEPSGKRTPTPRQKINQEKFKEAIAYGKRSMRDPILKMGYRLRARELNSGNAYNAAIRDFLNKPQINSIEVQKNRVFIDATDDFRIDKVEVQLLNASGEVVEEGPGIYSEEDGRWLYETRASDEEFLQAFIAVYDVPGNRVTSLVVVE